MAELFKREKKHKGCFIAIVVVIGFVCAVIALLVLAFFTVRHKAEQGNDEAQACLSLIYEYGLGVPKNSEKALEWCRKSAEQGNFRSQAFLGLWYLEGKYVQKDEKEAIKWLTMSAEQGYDKAQIALGIIYQIDQGVPQNFEESVKWFTKLRNKGMTMHNTMLAMPTDMGKVLHRTMLRP